MTARIRTLLPPIAGILILVVATAAPGQQPPNRFDGRWATTVTCRVSKDPAGLVYKFTTEVADSMLVGLTGTQGEPGYLLINGKISPEGIGRIYARGMTGKEEVIAGREIRAGTEYNYYIEAKFEGKAGSGNRVEGRACSFKFEKR